MHGDRLVSVVGLGGVGKTRLALEVAWRIHGTARWSVRWVSCGERGPGGSGSPFADLLRAGGGQADTLAELIGDRPTLLVLDGADGAVDSPVLDELFHRCAALRVLITARVPQRLHGEQVIPLAPLATPAACQDGDLAALGEVAAVRLLVSHVRRLRPGFRLGREEAPVIAALCRCLDGLPGALEFAAGWTPVQSPGQLMERLAAGPFTLAAPPVTCLERRDVRDALDETLMLLTARQRELLGLMVDQGRDWSVEQAAALSGRPPQDCLEVVHDLLCRGVIRVVTGREEVRFSVLNLFRVLWREEPDSWLPMAGMRGEQRALQILVG